MGHSAPYQFSEFHINWNNYFIQSAVSWWYDPVCNWPLLHGYIPNSVPLVVQQDPDAIFCRMAFCAAPTTAVLHRFIPLNLGALQMTDYQYTDYYYTSNHWPCPLSPGRSANFLHRLQLCSVSYSMSMLLLAEQFIVAKECSSLCGKEYNHFSLFSFITAAYLVMLFFLLTSSELYLSLSAYLWWQKLELHKEEDVLVSPSHFLSFYRKITFFHKIEDLHL